MFSGILCNPAHALCAIAASNNTYIWLFALSGIHESLCHSTNNPFVSRTETPSQVFEGSAILLNPGPANLSRDTSDQEDSVKQFALTAADVTLATGLWGYARHNGNLYGGQVSQIDRDAPGVVVASLDTKKVVPFPPSSVAGVGDWARTVQN